MVRVAYVPALTAQHHMHYIEAHRVAGTTLHGQGHFGKWLRKAAGTVAHAVTHSAIGQSLVEDGAKALGSAFAGPAGGAVAGNFAHQLMQQHAHGAQPAAPVAAAPRPPVAQQPRPTPNPTSAGGGGGDVDLGFGVPRRRAPARKKKAAPKRKPKRPF